MRIEADCGCEVDSLSDCCPECGECPECCSCFGDELYDADELGLDPEQDDRRRYHEEG